MILKHSIITADMVTKDDLAVGRLYPPLDNIRDCSIKIAAKIASDAYHDFVSS